MYHKTHHEAEEKANRWKKMPDVVTVIEIQKQTLLIILSRHRWWNL